MTTISAEQTDQKVSGWYNLLGTSIRTKLVIIMLLLTLVPITILSITEFLSARASLEEAAFSKIEAVRSLKADQVREYFNDVRTQTELLSGNPAISEGAQNLKLGYEEFGLTSYSSSLDRRLEELGAFYQNEFAPEYAARTEGGVAPIAAMTSGLSQEAVVLQHRYIATNEFPLGQKDQLVQAPGNTLYDEAHADIHLFLQETLEEFEFYDIFIVDAETGNILYSVFKETDFATSLIDGPYADTGLGAAFRAAVDADEEDDVIFIDYAAYTPSYEDAASFLSSPIGDELNEEEASAVLIVQIPTDKISSIVQDSIGLGETGENFLVGPDLLWRTDSRFNADLGLDTTILNPATRAETAQITSAFAGESNTLISANFQGESVLASSEEVVLQAGDEDQERIAWVLISEIDQAEVNAPTQSLLLQSILAVVLAVVAVLIISRLVANQVTRQIDAINATFDEYEAENFDARVSVITNDELGTLATSVNSSFDRIGDLVQTSDERDTLQNSIFSLLNEIADLADGDLTVQATVDEGITGSIADSINFLAENLRDSFSRVTVAAEQLSSSTNEVQITAEQLSEGAQSQAAQIVDTTAAIDEMSVSIQQVSENSALSATVGEQSRINAQRGAEAVRDTIDGMNRIRTQVQNTSKRIKRLGESTQEIDEMLALIRTITKRTSILALNASIQASRAGEAGRSFMVVAEEVEQLAERSADAAKQIESLVSNIQTETNEAVSAMESTTHEVVLGSQLANEAGNRLNEIESVSERLSDLIQGISRAAQQQARGSETIARSMNDIAQVTQQTTTGTTEQTDSMRGLAQLADELRAAVSLFTLENASA